MSKETCFLLAFPLAKGLVELEKLDIPYVIKKTAPPKSSSKKGQERVIRQIYKNNTLYLTVAEENWKPIRSRASSPSEKHF